MCYCRRAPRGNQGDARSPGFANRPGGLTGLRKNLKKLLFCQATNRSAQPRGSNQVFLVNKTLRGSAGILWPAFLPNAARASERWLQLHELSSKCSQLDYSSPSATKRVGPTVSAGRSLNDQVVGPLAAGVTANDPSFRRLLANGIITSFACFLPSVKAPPPVKSYDTIHTHLLSALSIRPTAPHFRCHDWH